MEPAGKNEKQIRMLWEEARDMRHRVADSREEQKIASKIIKEMRDEIRELKFFRHGIIFVIKFIFLVYFFYFFVEKII